MAINAKQLDVMVVDDTTVSRAFIVDTLNKMGITKIRLAKDGKAGFDALSRQPAHLVISDYNMPNMNGLEMLRELRRFKPTSRCGFILVTGNANTAIINQGRQLGMNNYLEKPVTVANLKARVESIVGKLA